MKTSTKFFASLAAISFALAGSVQAQLQTYQTIQANPAPISSSGYTGGGYGFDGSTGGSFTQGEVFTNILAVNSMTYNLFSFASGAPSLPTTLRATFGQWNVGTGTFVGATLNWENINVPALGSWTALTVGATPFTTYQLNFDIATANGGNYYATNASSTYALLVTQVTDGALNYGLGRVLNNAFTYGYGIEGDASGSFSPVNRDYTFSQISIVPNGNIVPAPESGTIAAILGCVLVAGLVGFRLRQQRQLAAAPVLAA